MEVYLVRHTETVCEKGICYGQSDVEIMAPYDAVFQSVLSQLPQDANLYSSPLLRCVLLANYIKDNSEINAVNEDSRLMEMNFGDWEVKNWDVIPPDDFTPWMTDFVNVRVPNGNSEGVVAQSSSMSPPRDGAREMQGLRQWVLLASWRVWHRLLPEQIT